MGAIFNAVKFETSDKKEVQAQWNEMTSKSLLEDGYSYSGEIGMLAGEISWKDVKKSSAELAEEYVEEHHDKWEFALAASFKDGQTKGWVVGGWCSS
jgi:hypothetical protein